MNNINTYFDLDDLPGEIWKPVKDYEDLYEVSNLGRLKRLEYKLANKLTGGFSVRKTQIIKPILQKSGYCHVGLWRNQQCKQNRLHRLVAAAFCPNDDPEHKTQINHLNENKQDNRAENLEWCTPRQNTLYGSCIEKRTAGRNKNAPNRRRPVQMISKLTGKILRTFSCIAEASVFCGANRRDGHISQCCKGRQISAFGYLWRYEDEYIY